MKLIENWADVLKKAWSMWGVYALFALGLLNDFLMPFLAGQGYTGPGFGTLVTVIAAATVFVRVLDQALASKANQG